MSEDADLSYLSIGIIYLLTIASMATVGMVVPMVDVFAERLAATSGQIGFAIALFSAPSAVLAALSGGLIDRIGARQALIGSAAFMIAGTLVVCTTTTLLYFYLALTLSGIAFAGISVSAPALMMISSQGPRRIRAMAFWSTYAPTGFSMGLLLAVPFAGTENWRMTFLIHSGLVLILMAAAIRILPKSPHAVQYMTSAMERLRELLAVFREIPVLCLAVAVALPNAVSYGTSLVAPSYLARVHDVSVALSSTTVAVAKILAMLVGGVVVGQLLVRNTNPKLLFAGVAAIGGVAQFILYYPGSGFAMAVVGLFVWLFAFGGMSGIAMALLPSVTRDPARSGAASGLVSQFISIASFAAPSIYFGMSDWNSFVVVAAVGLTIGLLLLPSRWSRAPKAA